ncbi:hypothetical protein MSG28_004084, partial [Choristoneura fumiferana]
NYIFYLSKLALLKIHAEYISILIISINCMKCLIHGSTLLLTPLKSTLATHNQKLEYFNSQFESPLRSRLTSIEIGCYAENETKLFMVADVVRSMQRPTAVIAMLCWSSRMNKQLYSALGGNVTHITLVQFLKTGAIPQRHAQDQHIFFLADLDCPGISSYLELSSLEKYFRSPFRWLLVGNGYNSEINFIPKALEGVDILADSEVILAQHLGDGSYGLHLIYKVGLNTEWKKELYGSWDENKRLQTTLMEREIVLRRLNLDNYEISICYVLTDNDSINHLFDNVNDHLDTITKANFPTTNHLLDFLNATRKMTIVDYIWSPTPTRSKFIFRQPKLSYETNLFILSFRAAVWYCTIGLLIMLVLAIFVAAHWEWKKTHRHENMKSETDPSILRASLMDVILLILGAACQQGSTVELKGSLGRVVMLVLFLALMFLYTSYAANIGLFAFHMETGVGYKFVGKYFQESEKCGLKEIQYLQVIDPWLAVRKNTPFKEMFKIGNYLYGRLASHSLLGAAELEHVFPDREVTIFVGTWNMNGQAPPKELADFIFPNQVKHVPDIFAIGTQESYSERTEWEITIQEYDPGSQQFDTSSKQRAPAYTDRILYKARTMTGNSSSAFSGLRRISSVPVSSGLKCAAYNSVQSICTSDHKPVWGLFSAALRPGTDVVPLAAGLFNREVYLEGIKRRRALLDHAPGTSAVCSIQ